MEFPKLFSPGNIGTLQLPNRILMGSMHLGYEGLPGSAERISEFYAARARGGAGLIITGGCAINVEAIGGLNFSCVFQPEDMETLAQIADRTHHEGGKIGLQLFHAGRYAAKEYLRGATPVAPSPIRSPLHPGMPREMNAEDILRTIDDFAMGALRAKDAGFDCVEVMGSEGYLINQFLSPVTNQRPDDWGGTIENRSRFGIEVMRAIRQKCGREYPVIYRMSGIDLIPGSSTWKETEFFARSVKAAGADAFNIGIGWHESRIPTINMMVPRAYYSFVSERIKKAVDLPCIVSNRINDPQIAEQVLEEGKADFVSMARAFLADPEFPKKAESGRSEFIQTCIACNQSCLDHAFRGQPTACLLNPAAGRESEMRLQPSEYNRSIAVVGSGPAGLEAAKILAQRGHRVTLFEKQNQIGGQLLLAVRVPGKEEFFNTIRHYRSYIQELGIRLELGCTATTESLKSFDAVVIATGATPLKPQIAGSDLPHCMDYEQFFNQEVAIPNQVVIIGAGAIGCDVAVRLAHAPYPSSSFFDDPGNVRSYPAYLQSFPQSKSITLTRRGKRIGEKLGPTTRWALIQLLENRGVQMLTQIVYQEITSREVRLSSRTGKEITVPAEMVIFATGQQPNSALYDSLKNDVPSYLIGAARLASEANAQTAIWEASELARKL